MSVVGDGAVESSVEGVSMGLTAMTSDEAEVLREKTAIIIDKTNAILNPSPQPHPSKNLATSQSLAVPVMDDIADDAFFNVNKGVFCMNQTVQTISTDFEDFQKIERDFNTLRGASNVFLQISQSRLISKETRNIERHIFKEIFADEKRLRQELDKIRVQCEDHLQIAIEDVSTNLEVKKDNYIFDSCFP